MKTVRVVGIVRTVLIIRTVRAVRTVGTVKVIMVRTVMKLNGMDNTVASIV